MYDLKSKFNEFYDNYVVLPQSEQNKLYEKKELNIKRLEEGLKEYNDEHKTSYSIKENYVQGSVKMSTVVQNEQNEYDIDVAVVFDNIEFENIGAMAARNIIASALERKTKQLKANPEVKTSCVRIKYSDGYHIDFAVYRNIKNNFYEHAGKAWEARKPNMLIEWFEEENKKSEKKLRKVIRLSKMFCKSRATWKEMPSGLIQTILCAEQLQNNYERLDELFYHTMKKIVERLENNIDVFTPIDNKKLTIRKIDQTRVINWKNHLKSKLEDLEILFQSDCSEEEAIRVWGNFFNHKYWESKYKKIINNESRLESNTNNLYSDTEEFIENLYPMNLLYKCKVSCKVCGNGFRNTPIKDCLALKRFLPHNLKINCLMEYTNCPQPYKIFWKVKNTGPESTKRNQIRGQIVEKGNEIVEHSNFYGNHYIECYIIKNNECVAKERIDIKIGRN